MRELLKAFADLAGAVLTLDALHAQHDTAKLITVRGADYVMTVKGNMPTLYKQLRKLPWARVPSVSSVSKDHGRRARRTIKLALAPAWIEFEGAAQVAQLRRTVVKKGKSTGRPLARCLLVGQVPFPVAPGPNRICAFQRVWLSSDFCVVIRRHGELQDRADRLDAKPVPVRVNELD